MKKQDKILRQIGQFVRLVETEIDKFRIIESHKRGKDVNWEEAMAIWMEQRFPQWKQEQWQMALQATRKPNKCG